MKRLSHEDSDIDLFMTDNIQQDSAVLPYAMELFSQSDKLCLDDTFEGLIKNFSLIGKEEIYAIPIGADIRGLYVNKTLLKDCGVEVPTNKTELLAACKKLKEKGYVPLQGNPGMFGQQLLYPNIANIITHAKDYKSTYNRVNQCEEGIEELFRGPLELLYSMVENKYYDYKNVETTLNHFIVGTEEDACECFFDKKAGEFGNVPFMTGPASMSNQMAQVKADNDSKIDYEFILAPVTDEGGCAYLSPTRAIAVNKNSADADWALEFMNYLFTEKNNKIFAEAYNTISNTKDAILYTSEKMEIPENQISELGTVTFDYGFYKIIYNTLLQISKANNPKYMNDKGDGEVVMYDFDYYMDQLSAAFKEQRKNGEAS